MQSKGLSRVFSSQQKQDWELKMKKVGETTRPFKMIIQEKREQPRVPCPSSSNTLGYYNFISGISSERRRLLRVSWTERRSSQSILKEISPEYSLEGLMLKPKLQYCGHLMQRADSLEKTLMLGKIEGKRRRGATEDEMVGWHH